jgi:hypothetical protein
MEKSLMVATVKMQLHLTVDIDKGSMKKYGEGRDTDAETLAMQELQDYLYRALHGWGGDKGATQFADMESGKSFLIDVDAVEGTDLPIWSEIRAAMNGALEDYGTQGFGLQFAPIAESEGPSCVKYVRKGKRIYIEYNQDLTVSVGVQDADKCNMLPIDYDKAYPPVLEPFAAGDILARYRMIALVERNPES